jgi:short-subunit dehydrogenase
METNFFAPLKIIQLVLPSMQERKSGTIVNISSVAGIDSLPSCGLYSASKHTLEGMSPLLTLFTFTHTLAALIESLSKEVAPCNITCLIVEPGGFRTNFLNALATPAKGLTAAYQDTRVDQVI